MISQLAVYETFEELSGRKSTLEELIADVSPFTRQSVLWLCAWIVSGMRLWDTVDSQPAVMFRLLIDALFERRIRLRLLLGYWQREPRKVLFHRRQILLIAKLAIRHCSKGTIDARANGYRFGSVLLKANDQFDYGLLEDLKGTDAATGDRETLAKIITEMIAVGEYIAPEIKSLIVRSHLMLTRFTQELRDDPDFVDVAAIHQSRTSLTLAEFEALIFGVYSRFANPDLQKSLIEDPGVLLLKDENFAQTAIPMDKAQAFLDLLSSDPDSMATALQQEDSGPNDFTIFRKVPLVKQFYNLHLTTPVCGFLMLDNAFLLEKILTGPYWEANAAFATKLHRFWGAVFELYVNELMRRACAGTQSTFIPDPRAATDLNTQICDGIVISSDSMVLLEYKSAMFRADTKYSGSHVALAGEIEKKLVYDRVSQSKKGVWQLADAVRVLFGPNASKIHPDIDLNPIKRVYLCIVTLDSIGATIGISPFLSTFLDERLNRDAFPSLQIRPLFCIDIETLENSTEYFADSSLPQVFERWFDWNPRLTPPLSAVDLSGHRRQENDWLAHEWDQAWKRIANVLFPEIDPHSALTQMKTAARQGLK